MAIPHTSTVASKEFNEAIIGLKDSALRESDITRLIGLAQSALTGADMPRQLVLKMAEENLQFLAQCVTKGAKNTKITSVMAHLFTQESIDITRDQKHLGLGGFGKVYPVSIKGCEGSYVCKEFLVPQAGHAALAAAALASRIADESVMRPAFIWRGEQYFPRATGTLCASILPENKALADPSNVINQLWSLLFDLQKANLVHRDIKQDNFLYTEGKIQLADMDLVWNVNKEQLAPEATVLFLPPEECNFQGKTGFARDIWAAGTALFQLATNRNSIVTSNEQLREWGVDWTHKYVLQEGVANPDVLRGTIHAAIDEITPEQWAATTIERLRITDPEVKDEVHAITAANIGRLREVLRAFLTVNPRKRLRAFDQLMSAPELTPDKRRVLKGFLEMCNVQKIQAWNKSHGHLLSKKGSFNSTDSDNSSTTAAASGAGGPSPDQLSSSDAAQDEEGLGMLHGLRGKIRQALPKALVAIAAGHAEESEPTSNGAMPNLRQRFGNGLSIAVDDEESAPTSNSSPGAFGNGLSIAVDDEESEPWSNSSPGAFGNGLSIAIDDEESQS